MCSVCCAVRGACRGCYRRGVSLCIQHTWVDDLGWVMNAEFGVENGHLIDQHVGGKIVLVREIMCGNVKWR
jgi:hypothetical protein